MPGRWPQYSIVLLLFVRFRWAAEVAAGGMRDEPREEGASPGPAHSQCVCKGPIAVPPAARSAAIECFLEVVRCHRGRGPNGHGACLGANLGAARSLCALL